MGPCALERVLRILYQVFIMASSCIFQAEKNLTDLEEPEIYKLSLCIVYI